MRRASRTTLAVLLLAIACACGGGSSQDDPQAIDVAIEDIAGDAGIADVTQTRGENCMADLDDDGLLDLILTVHSGVWPVMRGVPGGRFEEATGLGLGPEPRDRHGCAVADFDGNERLDVYFSIGACRGTCEAPKELWLQQSDGTFVDRAEAWGIADPGGRGRVPLVLDVNGDDRPDLYTGHEEGVDFPSISRVWINQGDRFVVQEGPATNDVGNLCAAAADIDGDGLDELAICTPKDGFVLYKNDGGELEPATDSFGVEDYGRRTVEFADLNGDDRPDLVTLAATQVQVHLNEGGRFDAPSFRRELEDGRDVAFGDLDGDGDLDLYVQQGMDTDAADQLFLNDADGRFDAGPEVTRPSTAAGDTVTAILDWNGTGRAAFLVNNGYQDTEGARQLIWSPGADSST